MLGTNQKQKQGLVRSCLIPIVGLVGFIAGCYLLCSGIFVLNGGQLSFAAPPPPTVIPTEVPTEVPTPEETATPVSYFYKPQVANYTVRAACYPLTLSNSRS